MKSIVHLGSKLVTLEIRDFDSEVDIDNLLTIDYSNLYGEAVTVPALLNQIGLLKAEAEKIYNNKKLEFDVKESEIRKLIRKNAVSSGDKLTEKSLDEMVLLDGGYQVMKRNLISAKYDLDVVDNIWWAVKSKDTKLNNLIKGVTPAELFNELIEGTINNILINKRKSIIEK